MFILFVVYEKCVFFLEKNNNRNYLKFNKILEKLLPQLMSVVEKDSLHLYMLYTVMEVLSEQHLHYSDAGSFSYSIYSRPLYVFMWFAAKNF